MDFRNTLILVKFTAIDAAGSSLIVGIAGVEDSREDQEKVIHYDWKDYNCAADFEGNMNWEKRNVEGILAESVRV